MSYELWAGDGAGWVECSAGVPATLVLATVPSCVINRPYRLACQNFGKANRLAHVKILILFMIKVVDIII